jgi:hypothetical protein
LVDRGGVPPTWNTIDVHRRQDENGHPLGHHLVVPTCRLYFMPGG